MIAAQSPIEETDFVLAHDSLQVDYEKLQKKHEAFRKKVVKAALKAKEDHDWCDEVDAILKGLGLAELLPPRYQVEEKAAASYNWVCSDYEGEYLPSAKAAIEQAKSYRMEEVDTQRFDFERNVERAWTPCGSITADTDIHAFIEGVIRSHRELVHAKYEIDGKEFEEDEYPIYRAVEISGTGKKKVLAEFSKGTK
jgi:hypothetical protein